MGYLAVWKILEEMIIEFRKKGSPVPASVMNDLKSAKTMITLTDVDVGKGEMTPKVEQYLGNVESYLVTEAQKHFSPEHVDEWLRRLEEATTTVCCEDEKEREESRFIPGLPRDQKWIRVEPITSLPAEELKQLAKRTNLSFKTEKDGHIVVYGKAEDIKEFVKKMTEQTSKQQQQGPRNNLTNER
jgi:hypothetical protein